MNPDHAGGYPGVIAYCVGIALGVTIFTWLIVQLSRHVRFAASGASLAAS